MIYNVLYLVTHGAAIITACTMLALLEVIQPGAFWVGFAMIWAGLLSYIRVTLKE